MYTDADLELSGIAYSQCCSSSKSLWLHKLISPVVNSENITDFKRPLFVVNWCSEHEYNHKNFIVSRFKGSLFNSFIHLIIHSFIGLSN